MSPVPFLYCFSVSLHVLFHSSLILGYLAEFLKFRVCLGKEGQYRNNLKTKPHSEVGAGTICYIVPCLWFSCSFPPSSVFPMYICLFIKQCLQKVNCVELAAICVWDMFI